MNNRINVYQQYLAELFQAYNAGDETAEDRLLRQLDGVWSEMTEAERAAMDDLSRRIAAGEISEADFIAHATAPPAAWKRTTSR